MLQSLNAELHSPLIDDYTGGRFREIPAQVLTAGSHCAKIPAMQPNPPCDSLLSWPLHGKVLATAGNSLSARCVAMMAEIRSPFLTGLHHKTPAGSQPGGRLFDGSRVAGHAGHTHVGDLTFLPAGVKLVASPPHLVAL
ncbi:hypothetical protein PSHT_05445 [Puccinia striiformis]|uniref:Uncharacterized protein n=1 Tax=Puccinia striiformis TaxID=27350 RepID=A0A2S4WA95_9BASI|nr:hypothetical protein PSHT_05445 [Puccinia striiformis]